MNYTKSNSLSSGNKPQSIESNKKLHETLEEILKVHTIEIPKEHSFTLFPYAVINFNNSKMKHMCLLHTEPKFGPISNDLMNICTITEI